MRAACLTLRTQEGVATLADLPKLLAFRSRVTAGTTDSVLRGFWAWYEELTDSSRSQVISPLMNKLRAFLLRPFVRDAIAGGHSTVDTSNVLDGGICLVIDECHNFLNLPYPDRGHARCPATSSSTAHPATSTTSASTSAAA